MQKSKVFVFSKLLGLCGLLPHPDIQMKKWKSYTTTCRWFETSYCLPDRIAATAATCLPWLSLALGMEIVFFMFAVISGLNVMWSVWPYSARQQLVLKCRGCSVQLTHLSNARLHKSAVRCIHECLIAAICHPTTISDTNNRALSVWFMDGLSIVSA